MNDINPILEAQGLGARLLLYRESIRIQRQGRRTFLFKGANSDEDISLASINDIQFEKAAFRRCYIRFWFINSLENKGVLVHFRDQKGIKYKSKQQPAFEEIKAAIENRKNNNRSDQSTAR